MVAFGLCGVRFRETIYLLHNIKEDIMFSKTWFTFLFLLSIIIGCEKKSEETTPAKKGLPVTDDLHETAQVAINDYYQLVDKQNYQDLGFKSLDELNRMELGIPIPVYFINLEDLRQFVADSDPNDLIKQPKEILYPIEIEGEIRCSLALSQRDGEWQTESFGRPKLSRAVIRMREQHASNSAYEIPDYFALEIPAMYLIFVGHHEGDEVMLTHVHEHKDLNFTAGETEPARDVFAKLAKTAKGYKSPLAEK